MRSTTRRNRPWRHRPSGGLGDRLDHFIACASIVANVCRDRFMQRLGAWYPQYGWERNKGYSTPEHREALLEHGFTRHHRLSFEPVEQLTLSLET